MKSPTSIAWGIGAALLALSAYAAPPSVNPEAPDLDTDITAKILKEKSKRNPGAMPAGNSSGGGSSGCGQVNINSNDDSKNKISGIGQIMGNKSTTIVTGDVINMANCK
jgi:hypothetical protein